MTHDGAWRRDLLITAALFSGVLGWDTSGLDLVVTRWFGTAQGFPWRDHWLARGVLHEGGRALAWVVLLALAVNVRWPLWRGPTGGERWHMLLLTLACVTAIPVLKQTSVTSCPWDLAEFGGTAPFVSHLRIGVSDGGPGRCFPSGHATAAFAFLGGYVGLRRSRPQLARRWLAGVLLAGLLFGGAQLVRGAHHTSHTLWAAFGCWVICALGAPRAGAACRPPAQPVGPLAPRVGPLLPPPGRLRTVQPSRRTPHHDVSIAAPPD